MRLPACLAFSVSLSLLAFSGCPPLEETDSPPVVVPQESNPEPNVELDLKVAPWSDVEQAIAAQQGKVVVVDLWSTTCPPCKEEFPGLVALHQQHGEQVACMAVSLDYYGDPLEPADSFQPAVSEFLQKQEATFPNFICTDATDEVLAKVGAGAVPTILVYGRDGQLAKMFEHDGTGMTYAEDITPFVVSLLE